MENLNLPESLYVDPREEASSSSSSSNTSKQSLSTADLHEIKRLIDLINQPETRTEAIKFLNGVQEITKGRGCTELGLLLWNSKDLVFALLQEFDDAYRKLSPPHELDLKESRRVCNALGLLQCIASHPEARMEFVKAHIPIYIYPFLYTTERLPQYDYVRVDSLSVIRMLVKEEPANTDIIHFLLGTEMVPLCLRCMDVGCPEAKQVATLVLGKILEHRQGKIYIGSFVDRFFAVTKVLSKMVAEFAGKPPAPLLNNIIMCYFYLSKIPWYCDALRTCYPQRLRDRIYLNYVCDASTRRIAEKVLRDIMAVQLPPVPLEKQFSEMRL